MDDEKKAIFMEEEEYKEYIKNQTSRLKKEAEENGIVIPENETPVASSKLYDMNKDVVRSLKKMNNMDINNALEKVAEWYIATDATHYALLNTENHYFTIFEKNEATIKKVVDYNEEIKDFIRELKDILQNWYGDNDIRAIDVDVIDGKPTGAVEIWSMWNGEPSVGYLFPYDEGVVYY